jgi:hypothetical protein
MSRRLVLTGGAAPPPIFSFSLVIASGVFETD